MLQAPKPVQINRNQKANDKESYKCEQRWWMWEFIYNVKLLQGLPIYKQISSDINKISDSPLHQRIYA